MKDIPYGEPFTPWAFPFPSPIERYPLRGISGGIRSEVVIDRHPLRGTVYDGAFPFTGPTERYPLRGNIYAGGVSVHRPY